jgi:hypothetical protein
MSLRRIADLQLGNLSEAFEQRIPVNAFVLRDGAKDAA